MTTNTYPKISNGDMGDVLVLLEIHAIFNYVIYKHMYQVVFCHYTIYFIYLY